jgi:hypothetical protein
MSTPWANDMPIASQELLGFRQIAIDRCEISINPKFGIAMFYKLALR